MADAEQPLAQSTWESGDESTDDVRTSTRPQVSVVLVARNEADLIGDCIESVLRACRNLSGYEVLLVDSNSSDETVEIASEYPVTVLQIPTDDLCTPSAGRFVGTEFARGDRLLFVDGDVILEDGWIGDAMELLDSADDVAGVSGYLTGYDNAPTKVSEPRQSDWLGGVALYERAALEDVGGFNPHHRSYEDLDLGYRLTVAGYRLVRLPTVAATHTDPGGFNPVRRWKNGYYTGAGQILRWSVSSPRVLAKHVGELWHSLSGVVWLILVAVLIRRRRKRALRALCLLPVGFVGVRLVQTRSTIVLKRVVTVLLNMVGIVRGVLIPPESGETFPLDAVLEHKEGELLGEDVEEGSQRRFSELGSYPEPTE